MPNPTPAPQAKRLSEVEMSNLKKQVGSPSLAPLVAAKLFGHIALIESEKAALKAAAAALEEQVRELLEAADQVVQEYARPNSGGVTVRVGLAIEKLEAALTNGAGA